VLLAVNLQLFFSNFGFGGQEDKKKPAPRIRIRIRTDLNTLGVIHHHLPHISKLAHGARIGHHHVIKVTLDTEELCLGHRIAHQSYGVEHTHTHRG